MRDSVLELNSDQMRETLQEIRAQLSSLSGRVAQLEQAAKPLAATPANAVSASPAAAPAPPAVEAGITEEEVLAISAAIAAWLGVHAHIRQIRLIRTGAWSQQGRVTIQASHRLDH